MHKSASLILVIGFLLTSCSPAREAGPSAGGLPKVLAAETFLGDIAQNVAGGRLKVEVLLAPGIDPHEFQARPQDVIKIAQSQVLIVNGADYETWLTKPLEASGGTRLIVTASDGLGVAAGADPHLWMNPLNVVQYAENMRDGLSEADPAGKDAYAKNAEAYGQKLKDLDAWIKEQVDAVPAERRLLVTNHDDLGHFAEAYGFRILGAVIPSVTNEASPSAQQMAELIQTLKSSGAPAIFLDVSENQNLARQIASESGAKVVTGLYVETLSAGDGPAPTYVDMMKYDVRLIVDALR